MGTGNQKKDIKRLYNLRDLYALHAYCLERAAKTLGDLAIDLAMPELAERADHVVGACILLEKLALAIDDEIGA